MENFTAILIIVISSFLLVKVALDLFNLFGDSKTKAQDVIDYPHTYAAGTAFWKWLEFRIHNMVADYYFTNLSSKLEDTREDMNERLMRLELLAAQQGYLYDDKEVGWTRKGKRV